MVLAEYTQLPPTDTIVPYVYYTGNAIRIRCVHIKAVIWKPCMTDIYLECAHYGLYPNVPVHSRAKYIALRLGQETMQPARLPVARVRLLVIALSS